MDAFLKKQKNKTKTIKMLTFTATIKFKMGKSWYATRSFTLFKMQHDNWWHDLRDLFQNQMGYYSFYIQKYF